jgi:hypothetical protein
VPDSERRLIALISTEGKSKEQLEAQALQAIQKWQDAQRPQRDTDR